MNPGIPIAFMAAAFAGSKDLVSKKLSFNVHSLVSTLASFSYALPFYLLALTLSWFLGYEDFVLSPAFFLFVLLRSITDSFAESFKMYSLEKGDVSLVMPFVSLSPVFLLFLSPCLTGEPISFLGTAGILIIVAGCIIILNKFSSDKFKSSLRVVGTSLISAFFFALNACFDWLAVHEASPVMSGFAMSLCSCFLILPLMGRVPNWKSQFRTNYKPFLLRGVFEAAFMISKLAALQFISAHYTSALTKTSILVSIIGGGFLFKEENIKRRLLGSALIIIGVVIIIFEL